MADTQVRMGTTRIRDLSDGAGFEVAGTVSALGRA
jgi:NADPH:quinone reductase-like Zn-dependent oxidoreductase